MNLRGQLFKVSGNKMESLLVADKALLFSSKSYQHPDEFRQAWSKSLTLATKVEVKFDVIKSVTKEDADDDIKIKYKGSLGMPGEAVFSFAEKNDTDRFYEFLVNELSFQKTEERLSPVKAVLPNLFALAITIAITLFAHYQSIAIANGTVDESGSRRSRSFNSLIELLGTKGVWLVGMSITLFIGYKIWKRFSHPPVQIKLLPANAAR
jgi:hypothetical protein